jgi:hypothetical protein
LAVWVRSKIPASLALDFVTCRKILGAYPYLRPEYSPKLHHAQRIWRAIDLLEGGKDWPEMLEIMMLTRTEFDNVLNRMVGRDNPERAGIQAECSECTFRGAMSICDGVTSARSNEWIGENYEREGVAGALAAPR